jgi:hypothetical protein
LYLLKGFKADDYLKSCGFSYVNFKRQRAKSDVGCCKKGLITEYAKSRLKTNSKTHDASFLSTLNTSPAVKALNFHNEAREKRKTFKCLWLEGKKR